MNNTPCLKCGYPDNTPIMYESGHTIPAYSCEKCGDILHKQRKTEQPFKGEKVTE